jgi:hypothetical protein
MPDSLKTFYKTATGILTALAKTFPVACASDEFYYFPHIAFRDFPESTWDDYSPDSVSKMTHDISDSISVLNETAVREHETELLIDKNVIIHFLTTLNDYLKEDLFLKQQPSFYLTVINIGLVRAVSAGDNEVIHQMIDNLSGFIEQAAVNLEQVPSPWLEIGLSMIDDSRNLIHSIPVQQPGKTRSLKELDHFASILKGMKPEPELRIGDELLKRIYARHMATGLELTEISGIIQDEIDEMWELMIDEAGKILKTRIKTSQSPKMLISRVSRELTCRNRSEDDILLLFKAEIERIRKHLNDIGILSDEMNRLCPVHVREMPDHIRAIRSASSYSIYPVHPPREGIFFVLSKIASGKPIDHRTEYRMLTAHETYPGHHLLDSSRLSLKNMIRRSIEFPVFYEGWACFGEMLLEKTGYYCGPADRFSLAKRRFWRAIRGQVDLGLQTGKLDFDEAAGILQDAGIQKDRALSAVKVYTLNPGYQVCYTIGIRRFLDLFDRYGRTEPVHFVKTVLGGGEILFRDLEKRLEAE